LVLGELPTRAISEHSAESRQRANLEEPGFFCPWNESQPYPVSSMPAQIASKCALRQGEAAFERFHEAVFRALFEECRDISDGGVLLALAGEAGLDVDRFRADLQDGTAEAEVLAEYEEARSQYVGWGVPLAIVGGRYPVAGAVPEAIYRRAVDLSLAGGSG
jgi:predicted DsbA family dithiol-disulfide isomerase